MTEEDERERYLEGLEARRECRYGGCRCCALLVEMRDERDQINKALDQFTYWTDDSNNANMLMTVFRILGRVVEHDD